MRKSSQTRDKEHGKIDKQSPGKREAKGRRERKGSAGNVGKGGPTRPSGESDRRLK